MVHRLKQLTLLLGDLIAFYLGLYLSAILRYWSISQNTFGNLIHPFTVLFVAAIIIFFIVGLYDTERTRNTTTFYQKIIVAFSVWVLIGIIYFYFNPLVTVTPKTILLINACLNIILVSLWRYTYNLFLATTLGKTAVVFAGLTPEVAELTETLSREPERGFTVGGIISSHASTLGTYTTATTLDELFKKNPTLRPGLIVIAPTAHVGGALIKECYSALFNHVGVIDLAEFYESVFKRLPPFTFSEAWFIAHLQEQYKKIYDRLRVLLDYCLGLLLGVVFAALYVPLAIIIKMTSPGPVLFKQERVGRGGAIFTIYKFRTMRALAKDGSAEVSGPEFATSNDSRVTLFGKFLRKTRLDEVPQCINILRGEMGFIGPRPERPTFVGELTDRMPFYPLRHLIRPGLTGWAQLHKSYYGNIEENLFKLEYDLYYVKNRGLLLDLTILLKTVGVVARMLGR